MENLIKMDDLGVPLFLETSYVFIENILLLTSETWALKENQKSGPEDACITPPSFKGMPSMFEKKVQNRTRFLDPFHQ